MNLLPNPANLNIGYGKAAAPDKGAAAFFCSTDFWVLRNDLPLFESCHYVGNTSKKAWLLLGASAATMTKIVANWGYTFVFSAKSRKQ